MIKSCKKCGCERKILIKAEVSIDSGIYRLERFCIPCLLCIINVANKDDYKGGTYNYNKAIEMRKNFFKED
ncbi:MAG: hypothetical protein GWP19_07865 [Planctomycetia bacterium]|nr:hypothetical protein [Planctomycetia bacterium]